ncbi:hypothetical protein [Methylobacterium tarhaniae]|uniref:hypothetical protein n=1 Tax=Methylobacterium tarhaniae TaxID=1187852 RepID=UPI00069EAAC1|nr:hypothetical protein [Methylobacterium tarhaniae]
MPRLLPTLALSAVLGSPLAPAFARDGHHGGVDLAQLDVGPVPVRDAGAVGGPGAAVAGACDTAAWAGYVNGTSSPQQSCYTTKTSPRIDIPFAASVGIGPERMADPLLPAGDQTYIQLAQQLVQARTTQGNMRQESGLVVNFESMTGAGPQTNHGQKVALYVPTLVRPGGGNTWAFNPALTILGGVGVQSQYNTEIDMTNFNGPYLPGGKLGNAASVFRTFSGFPITAGELWSGETPAPSTLTATTRTGSPSITFSGTLHVGDRLSGPGIAGLATVAAIGGDPAAVNQGSGTATLNQAATATGSRVTLTRETYNMINGHLYQGAHLIRDNTFYDGTSAITSVNIAGKHFSGVNTSQGTMPYALIAGAGQNLCLNSLDGCLSYADGALRYVQGGAAALTATPARMTTSGLLNSPLGTPASSKAPCAPGDWAHDANFVYTCVAANTWKRAALSSW